LAEDVFGVPLSLGTVGHLREQMSAALASAHAEAVQAVRGAAFKNVDEDGVLGEYPLYHLPLWTQVEPIKSQ
jgi:hypothetical protein